MTISIKLSSLSKERGQAIKDHFVGNIRIPSPWEKPNYIDEEMRNSWAIVINEDENTLKLIPQNCMANHDEATEFLKSIGVAFYA